MPPLVSVCTHILLSTDLFLYELLFKEHIFQTATITQTVILNLKHFCFTDFVMHAPLYLRSNSQYLFFF
jgi:hypothetical protein